MREKRRLRWPPAGLARNCELGDAHGIVKYVVWQGSGGQSGIVLIRCLGTETDFTLVAVRGGSRKPLGSWDCPA